MDAHLVMDHRLGELCGLGRAGRYRWSAGQSARHWRDFADAPGMYSMFFKDRPAADPLP